MADDFAKRFDKMVWDAMTSNIEPSERFGAFSMAHLQLAMLSLPKGPAMPAMAKIVESVHMVDRVEDWSNVRSPSRTKRRMRYNAHRVFRYTPKREAIQMPDGSLVMHPAMAAEIRSAISQPERKIEGE